MKDQPDLHQLQPHMVVALQHNKINKKQKHGKEGSREGHLLAAPERLLLLLVERQQIFPHRIFVM
jgi:hypothetical protein